MRENLILGMKSARGGGTAFPDAGVEVGHTVDLVAGAARRLARVPVQYVVAQAPRLAERALGGGHATGGLHHRLPLLGRARVLTELIRRPLGDEAARVGIGRAVDVRLVFPRDAVALELGPDAGLALVQDAPRQLVADSLEVAKKLLALVEQTVHLAPGDSGYEPDPIALGRKLAAARPLCRVFFGRPGDSRWNVSGLVVSLEAARALGLEIERRDLALELPRGVLHGGDEIPRFARPARGHHALEHEAHVHRVVGQQYRHDLERGHPGRRWSLLQPATDQLALERGQVHSRAGVIAALQRHPGAVGRLVDLPLRERRHGPFGE